MKQELSSVTVPCESLYWAVLDPAPLGAKSIRPEQRGFLFESEVPAAIEELQCAYAPLADGKVLACGIERERLPSLAGPGVVSLSPASLPDWLPEEVQRQTGAAMLELLHGEFEPSPCRRARRQFGLVAAGSVSACAAILLMGAIGRVRALDAATALADTRRAELVRAALAGAPKRAALPDDLRLEAELRELRGTRSSGAPLVDDVGPVLAASLAAWPDGVAAQVDGMSVSCAKITMRGQAITMDDLQAIVDGIEAIPGWRTAQPVFRVAKDGLAFNLEAASETKSPRAGGAP